MLGDRVDEVGKGSRRHSASSAGSDPQGDDVVHCKCGSDVDEGFMIQVW